MKPFTTIAVVVLAVVALIHLIRLFTGVELIVAGWVVPVWGVSLPGLLIAGGLAVMLWREARTP
jgi:small neutral amino acid transporter SnatA (MarC family)